MVTASPIEGFCARVGAALKALCATEEVRCELAINLDNMLVINLYISYLLE
jgi:hypothetical protein